MTRWNKSVMQESGIDIKIFEPHSSRSASAVATTSAGVAINDILKQRN